jgi:hypothetical protein
MTQDEARQRADTIMSLFWDNFLKSESAFIMRDVIAIALEDVARKTLKGDEPKSKDRVVARVLGEFRESSDGLNGFMNRLEAVGLKIVEK